MFKQVESVALRLLLVIGVLAGTAGCVGTVTKPDLPGSYLADYGFATETLQIDEGGAFKQQITVKADGRVAKATGSWRFDPTDGHIYFSEEFLVVVDGFGKLIPDFDSSPRKAISILPVRRSFGKIQIGTDPRVPYKRL